MFIVVEGLDRSGKTTQCKMLYDALKAQGCDVVSIAFPVRTTATGELLDAHLKNQGNVTPLTPQVMHLLFSANRWEQANHIRALLEAGKIIVCDRYTMSGSAYSMALGLSQEWCRGVDAGLPKPDFSIYLDIAPEAAAARGEYGAEVYDDITLQEKIRTAYMRLVEDERCAIIQAGNSIDRVHQNVLKSVSTFKWLLFGSK